VLGAEEDHDTVALRVEAAGNVEKSLLDNLLNALSVASGEVLVQDVVAATSLDKVQDGISVDGGVLGRHGSGGRVRAGCCSNGR
jgi:hypothetical protein